MLLRRPRWSRLLYCSRLPRHWLSVIPSLLLPHLALGIILFLLPCAPGDAVEHLGGGCDPFY
jgi:hypothetical protein